MRLVDGSWAALAAGVVDAGEPLPATEGEAATLAFAWALKDHGYAAWSRDPAVAVRAASALRALQAAASGRVPALSAGVVVELHGIATWMDGIAELTRGRMSEAVLAFDGAASAFRQIDARMQAARVHVPKIMALSVLGLHDAAADCGEAALSELTELGDTESAARVSLNLGNLHRRRHDFRRAIAGFRAAAVMSARLGDHERSIMADIGMADALASTGRLTEALLMFARAGMRAQQHGFPVLQALVEETVALVDLARGRYGAALAGFEAARRRYETLAMPQHLATAEKQLADAYLELRLLPEAARGFEQALRHFDALQMPVETAWTLLQRGRMLALSGAADRAVDDVLTQAAVLFDAQGVPAGLATVSLARAERALSRGDAITAIGHADAAAARYADAGLVEGRARAGATRAEALLAAGQADAAEAALSRTLADSREQGLHSVQLRCEVVRGQCALAAGRRDDARAAFEAAIGSFERQRDALPGDDLRHAFQSGNLQPYRELLRMALADADAGAGAGAVLQALERFRARALDERLAQRLAPNPIAEDPAIDLLRTQWRWLDRRLQKQQGDGGGDDQGRLLGDVRRAEHALLESVRRQRLAGDAVQPQGSRGPVDTGALQGALSRDEALVEFGLSDDELFACIVTRDAITTVRRLAAWTDVAAAVRDVRFQIETLRQGPQRLERHGDQLLRRVTLRLARLYDLLWAPLETGLADRRRVMVVAHGCLASVPWTALHDGTGPLLDRFGIALAPSARAALRGLSQTAMAARGVLALGETTSLRHAGDEARHVAGLFRRSRVLLADDASVGRFGAEAPGFDVLHLACHARFRADNPMFSALQLVDGPLTVEAIERLGLTAAIVTLSACDTGLADGAGGDEMVGLVRGFLVAGARRVVASLWPVDDAATREFMARFYGGLQAGTEPVVALRDAQSDLRRSRPHPFHWAPFVLHGGF